METLSANRKISIWNKDFVCILLCNAFLALNVSSVNTLVTTYAKYLGAGLVLIGMLAGFFYFVSFAMRPISGPLTTKLNKKSLLIFANVLGVIVNLGYALTGSVFMFIVFRIINGLQFSIIGSLSMTIASDTLPPEKMGTGLGIYSMGGAMAMAIGPTIGMGLNSYGLQVGGERFSYMLVFLFATLCMTLSLVPSFLIKVPLRSKEEIASTGVWYKNIIAVNAIPPAIVMMLISMGYLLYYSYMVPYAQTLGISGISYFFTVYAIAMIVIRPISGRLVDKLGVFKLIVAGVALFSFSFIVAGFSKSLILFLVDAAIASIGYSTAQPAIMAMCIQSVPTLKRSVASNTNFFGQDLGSFIGPLVGSIIYSLTGSYATMFYAMVVPGIIGIIVLAISWRGYEKNRKKFLEQPELVMAEPVAQET